VLQENNKFDNDNRSSTE